MAIDSRESILTALRAAAPEVVPRPERARRAPPPASKREALRSSLEAAGGRLVEIDALSLPVLLESLSGLESAAHVWSSLPGLPARGSGAQGRAPRELAHLDFALLRGVLAVAENGAVWHVPASPLERAAALLAEHLVLVVDRTNVVADLHDAYARIEPARASFGWLLSGPSKTADIEQALVFGAHGPRQLTLLLVSPPGAS